MLERISDGRTDLVFDYLSAGHPADSTDAHGLAHQVVLTVTSGARTTVT